MRRLPDDAASSRAPGRTVTACSPSSTHGGAGRRRELAPSRTSSSLTSRDQLRARGEQQRGASSVSSLASSPRRTRTRPAFTWSASIRRSGVLGFGRRLCERFFVTAQLHGRHWVRSVSTASGPSIAFHRALGFVPLHGEGVDRRSAGEAGLRRSRRPACRLPPRHRPRRAGGGGRCRARCRDGTERSPDVVGLLRAAAARQDAPPQPKLANGRALPPSRTPGGRGSLPQLGQSMAP